LHLLYKSSAARDAGCTIRAESGSPPGGSLNHQAEPAMNNPSTLSDPFIPVEPLDAPHSPSDRLIRGIVLGGFLLVLAVEAWLLLHMWSTLA